MSDGREIITSIAVEVAKQITTEVYKDGLSPAVKETGSILQDIVKTLHLALAPFQLGAALQDRLKNFLDQSIRRVPQDRRISPPPQILGPVIEGIKYEPEGSPIEQMFSELLSRSFDKERINEAHPAFPHLIRQLSYDEAEIIKALVERERSGEAPFKRITRNRLEENNRWRYEQSSQEEFPRNRLEFPENLGFYFEHLNYLGIAGLFQFQTDTPVYEIQEDQVGNKLRVQTHFDQHLEYKLTSLGSMLAKAGFPA